MLFYMNDQDRERAIGLLEKTRVTLREALAGVSQEEATWKPEPDPPTVGTSGDRWSILQYVEHLSVADDHLVALVKKAMDSPAKPETPEQRAAREAHIRTIQVPRGLNKAPHVLLPVGNRTTVADALAAFEQARDRTIQFARTVEGDLRSHFVDHPVFGPLDAYQWLVANARHVDTHSSHIRELRALWITRTQ